MTDGMANPACQKCVPLDHLTYLVVLRDDITAAIDAEIDRLHRLDVNYGTMATALGMSRQAVRQRHARYQAKQEARKGTQ